MASDTRIVIEAMRLARNDALEAAIRTCQLFAASGGSAEACVCGLRDLKEMVNAIAPQPSSQN